MDLTDAGHAAAKRLAEAVEDPNISDAAASDALALAILAVSPLDDLDAIEQSLLAGFAQRAGIDAADAASAALKIDAYFQSHPLPGDLASTMTAVLRELLATNNAVEAAAALGSAADAASKVPVAQRGAVEGAQRMGVMGRFGLSADKKR